MLDELLGKAKEDGLVVQEVVTHFQFSGYYVQKLLPDLEKNENSYILSTDIQQILLYRTLVS